MEIDRSFPLTILKNQLAIPTRRAATRYSLHPIVFIAFLAVAFPGWKAAGAQQAQALSLTAAERADGSDSVSSDGTGTLPDDPQAQGTSQSADMGVSQDASPSAQQDQPAPQTKRILGIIPNFRAISAGQKLPPQTVKDKFMDATEDSFDYSSIFIPLVLAGYSLETNATPEFGHGGVGYGRYLWHSVVDQTSENYMVEFVVPVLTHEDTRYYTLGRGGFVKRAGYALSRAVVTRSDSGKEVFNMSEVFGAGASSGLSNLYYPSAERSFGNTGKQWGIDVGVDAISFMAKEFWPDINRKLFHGKQ